MFVALVAALLASACSESPTRPSPIDRVFTLVPGQVAQVEGAGFDLRFDGVEGDSRCPADAFCILGGDAAVRLTVLAVSGARSIELRTGSLQPVREGDVTIALVELQPYPFSARPIEPHEYRATLRVTR